MIRLLKLFVIFFFSFSFLFANEKVVLQLKWLHQFQFAGYYAAKEKGFYKELGLDVEIRQRDMKFNNIEQVLDGKAQYGVADSILMLYKAKGEPAVIVSPIFQHSPSVLISLKNNTINSPYELDGKNLLFYPNDTDGFSILAMIKKLNVNPILTREREKGDYVKLLTGEFDGMPGYLGNEPFYFKQRNVDINIIQPSSYGFDLYGDMLFTNKEESTNHPQRVEKFREASLKGWEYALENKEEIIQLIHKKYNKTKSLEHLRYEAEVIEQIINKESIPLGSIDEGRVQYISELYKEYGLISKSFNIRDFIFNEYKTGSKLDLTKEEKEYLDNKKILKVSNELDFAPFDFLVNGKARGFSIELLNLLAKKLGIRIEYINGYTWTELVELFKKRELDLLHTLAITKERESYGIFSNAYTRYQTHFVTRESNAEIESLAQIKDKTIVVGKDWAIDHFIKRNYPEIKVIRVNGLSEILDYVSSGKAYAAILNQDVANYQIRKKNILNLKVSNWCKEFDQNKARKFHFMAQKNSPLLISSLNKAIESLTIDEINELNEKWLYKKEKNKFTKELTLKEKEFIKKNPIIKFRVRPNRPPFEFIKDGKPIGVAIDYVRKSAENIGLNIEFVVNNDPLAKAYSNINGKRENYDTLLFSVKSSEREKRFSFGQSYLSYPMMIITHKNSSYVSSLGDLDKKNVAIEKGFLTNKWLKNDYPDINIVEAKDTEDALKMVNDSAVDAYVGNVAVANYLHLFGGLNNIKIAAPSGYGNIKFSFIAPKEWPELSSILDKGYNKISQSEHSAIQQKWFSFQTIEKIDYSLIWKIVGIVLVVLIWFLWWNRKLVVEKNKTQKALKELKKVQEERIRQQQVILEQSRIASMGEMIGNIAHQWRQPLSAVSATISSLKMQKELNILDDKSFNKSLNTVLKNTQYLSDTIDTFRDYIKGDKRLEVLVLENVVKDALDIASPSVSNYYISLEERIDFSKLTKVNIIHSELVQVILNIINNAKDVLIERSIKNPNIKIVLEVKGDSAVLSFEDNAGGVPEDIIDKIFDPYFTTKHQSQGTGLGLNMSYKIISESLSGKLYVKNADKGAVFYIELPIVKGQNL